jgi:hypothetical protein
MGAVVESATTVEMEVTEAMAMVMVEAQRTYLRSLVDI